MWYKAVFCWQILLHMLIQTNGFQSSYTIELSRGPICRTTGLTKDGTLLKMDNASADSESSTVQEVDNEKVTAAAAKFQITTCLSPSCNRKRKEAGLDPLSTFASMYERSKQTEGDLFVAVEEGPCMGACQFGPCVAIQHDEFDGSVALEGMTDAEFSDRVFQNIFSEEDADRVWNSVENAVQLMAEEEE